MIIITFNVTFSWHIVPRVFDRYEGVCDGGERCLFGRVSPQVPYHSGGGLCGAEANREGHSGLIVSFPARVIYPIGDKRPPSNLANSKSMG